VVADASGGGGPPPSVTRGDQNTSPPLLMLITGSQPIDIIELEVRRIMRDRTLMYLSRGVRWLPVALGLRHQITPYYVVTDRIPVAADFEPESLAVPCGPLEAAAVCALWTSPYVILYRGDDGRLRPAEWDTAEAYRCECGGCEGLWRDVLTGDVLTGDVLNRP